MLTKLWRLLVPEVLRLLILSESKIPRMVAAETSAPVAQSGKSPNSKTGSPSKEVEQR